MVEHGVLQVCDLAFTFDKLLAEPEVHRGEDAVLNGDTKSSSSPGVGDPGGGNVAAVPRWA